tara:strand:- start:7690 stop:8079 length:390 start_codon:yes stop_codon:yes gene_type:complete
MRNIPKKLVIEILNFISERPDISISAVMGDSDDPQFVGTRLMRFQETELRAPDSYNPFQYTGWKYYGQAFCLGSVVTDTNEKGVWVESFEEAGGKYVEVESMYDIYEVFGEGLPGPWDEYERREKAIKK